MQPLGTKKSCNLSGLKKHAISWDKKITQPVEKKKNHATLRDKIFFLNLSDQKKTRNLSEKANRATSQYKKKSRNLSGQKNDATSQDIRAKRSNKVKHQSTRSCLGPLVLLFSGVSSFANAIELRKTS